MTQLKSVGLWEYNCLIRDMRAQGDNWSYEGGFEAWFNEIFMIEESWIDVRNNYKLLKSE